MGRTVGQTDGRTDGRTDKRKNGQTDRCSCSLNGKAQEAIISNPTIDKIQGKFVNNKRVESASIELAISPVKNIIFLSSLLGLCHWSRTACKNYYTKLRSAV